MTGTRVTWILGAAVMIGGPAANGATDAAREAAREAAARDAAIAMRLPAVLDAMLEDEPDPIVAAELRLREARSTLASADASPVERSAAITRLVDAHRARVRAAGSDPRRIGWEFERAEDAWRWVRSHEGADVRVLLGVARPIDRERVALASREMVTATAAADAQIDRLLGVIESDPRWPDDAGLAREHRRLSMDERLERGRVLDGLGHGLAAAIGDPDVDSLAAEERLAVSIAALEAARDARGSRLVDAPVDAIGSTLAAARRLAGHLSLRRGDRDDAAALFASAREDANEAGDRFGAGRASIARAAMAGADELRTLLTAPDALDARLPGAERAFLELTAADAIFRTTASEARRGAESWSRAVVGWAELAERGAGWRAAVLERAGLAITADDPVLEMPALAVVAHAIALDSGRSPAPAALVARLDEIAGADARGPDGDLRAEAAWRAGRLGAARGEGPGTTAVRFVIAAECEPNDDRARAMFDAGLRLAIGAPAPAAGAIDPIGRAAALLGGRHAAMPGADAWRLALANRLVVLGRGAGALDLIDRVREDPALDANRLAVRLDALLSLAPGDLRDGLGDPVARDLIRTLAAARGLLETLSASDPARPALASRASGDRAAWIEVSARLSLGEGVQAWRAAGAALEASIARGSPDPATPALIAAAARAFGSLDSDADRRASAVVLAATGAPAAIGVLTAHLDDAIRADDEDRSRPIDHAGRRLDVAESAGAVAGGAVGGLARLAGLPDDGDDAEAVVAFVASTDPGTVRGAALRSLARSLAEVLRRSGAPESAAPWYGLLGGLEASDPVVLMGAAECAYARGDESSLAAAMPAWRRLAGDRGRAGDARWWRAQLRMLQSIDSVGRGVDRIGPRIARLRRDDPDLGGPPTYPAFQELARTHGGGGGS